MFLQTEIGLYLALGFTAVLVNVPVITVVFLTAQLRFQKEFVIIAGLCLVDAVNGLVFLLIGVYRWKVVSTWN
uniref:G_PROTEIN_RECEP_F1_2 domain-containing protein n=1 Tax=Steinernema glaseri TaxID=37863 RepID=A0A1I7ZKD1_9BILA